MIVTGADGFIGRNLLSRLTGDIDVLGVGLDFGNEREWDARVLRADLLTADGLRSVGDTIEESAPSELRVVHLVGLSQASRCEAEPHLAAELNVRSVREIWRLAEHHRASMFVLPSTALVYGPNHTGQVDETVPVAPAGAYARTKHEAEQALFALSAGTVTTPVVLRLANVYGAGMHPDTLIPLVRRQLAEGLLQLREYVSVRDYVHVADVARALSMVLEGRPRYPLYNVGTGVGSSVRDVVRTLARVAGLADLSAAIPSAKERGPALVLSCRRIADDLGWRPTLSLEDGLAEMIATEEQN